MAIYSQIHAALSSKNNWFFLKRKYSLSNRSVSMDFSKELTKRADEMEEKTLLLNRWRRIGDHIYEYPATSYKQISFSKYINMEI